MSQEPDTPTTEAQEPADPFALLVNAAASARGTLEASITHLAEHFIHTTKTTRENDDLTRAEILTAISQATEVIRDVSTVAVKHVKELDRLQQQGVHHHEATRKRITAAAMSLAERLDKDGSQLAEISDSQAEHYRLTETVLAKLNPLPEALFDATENARDQVGQLATACAEHQALTSEVRELLTALTPHITDDGENTREQLGAALSLLRNVLDATGTLRTEVADVETAMSMVMGSVRDQILQPLDAQATAAETAAAQHAERLATFQHFLEGVVVDQARHGDMLTALSDTAAYTAKTLTTGQAQGLEAITAAGEENRRTLLDAEQRLSSAATLSAERTASTLETLRADVQLLAENFDAVAVELPTAAAIESLRGDVAALSELLAGSVEDFTGSVERAITDLAAMRAAWSQESAQMMQTLERMGAAFLEKAAGSQRARDEAVI
ncbi:hypothetical protein AB0O47_38935, partial [Streptomyces noursei]|uniref:hypothetical protein n=1 Tax=Streptomyces noursei TaxID=1971 RepID=UPI00344C1F7F